MTYFPILIKYINSECLHVIYHPEEIESGRGFIVLEINYKER